MRLQTQLLSVLQDKSPDYDAYCMLAEAYGNLQEPDKAAAAYEVRAVCMQHVLRRQPMGQTASATQRSSINGSEKAVLSTCRVVVVCLLPAVSPGPAAQGLQPGSPGGQGLRVSTRLQQGHRPLQQVRSAYISTARRLYTCNACKGIEFGRQQQQRRCRHMHVHLMPAGPSATTPASWGCSTPWRACCSSWARCGLRPPFWTSAWRHTRHTSRAAAAAATWRNWRWMLTRELRGSVVVVGRDSSCVVVLPATTRLQVKVCV